MQHRRRHRATSTVLGVLALTAALSVTATPAAAGPPKAEPVSFFPTDELTVRDPGQLTGRRVALPTTGCATPVACGLLDELNELDGFDLDPRIAVRFDRAVDPAVAAARVTVEATHGGWRTGVDRVVWDPATATLHAHPTEQLAPGRTYRIRVEDGRDTRAGETTFTTLSATDGLLDLRRQIDTGRAFADSGITDRGLRVEGVFPADGTTIAWARSGAPSTPQSPNPAPIGLPPSLAGSTIVFGSYLAPSWLQSDVTIAQTPTRDAGPRAVGAARLPFVAVLPPGTPPPGGWPVAVFGHGFTSSTNAVFPAAATNVTQGIATIATNVVGHGYGPGSTWEVTRGGQTTSVPAYGRGVDQDGNGVVLPSEGSSASGPAAAVSSRDALRQTAADVMTLVRAVGGTDVDRNGTPELSGREVAYVGQSFGGIYGTLVAGADPTVARSVLDVPGGPITEIARLSPSFRPLTTAALQAVGILGPTDPDFRERLPLRGQGPLTVPDSRALAIQEYLARATWLARSGSPETFAPLVDPRRVLVQVAFGDQTVPNPTSSTLVDVGDLWSRTSLYRNDRTDQRTLNPHAFLLDLRSFPTAAQQGQTQVAAFLGRGQVLDPDGAGDVWEVPVRDPVVLRSLNFGM
ncbi:hypothetical protein ACU610_19530 [Geodermatophilus sp. URMC 61]|uniref:hypothetical protein n=1 Tax=Geodermatophilus sp. URMC 61 TaxID=3423411 RepID=UPI00406C83F1